MNNLVKVNLEICDGCFVVDISCRAVIKTGKKWISYVRIPVRIKQRIKIQNKTKKKVDNSLREY